MDEQKARQIIDDYIIPGTDDINGVSGNFTIRWFRTWRRKTAHLNGDFTADQLEALAWWMRNKQM